MSSAGDLEPPSALEAQVARLRAEVAEIETVVALLQAGARPAPERPPPSSFMDETAAATNPYRRLVACHAHGRVRNFERMRRAAVAVVGVGGVGALVAEALARGGISQLVAVDPAEVSGCATGGAFFTPAMVGAAKVTALQQRLEDVNPDVRVSAVQRDVLAAEAQTLALTALTSGGFNGGAVDCVVCCVDSAQARLRVNQLCLQLDLPMVDVRVKGDGLGGEAHLVRPGVTACLECHPETVADEPVVARLPQTEQAVAGAAATLVTHLLLATGAAPATLRYDGLGAVGLTSAPAPANERCPNTQCKLRQAYSSRSGHPGAGGVLEAAALALTGGSRSPSRSPARSPTGDGARTPGGRFRSIVRSRKSSMAGSPSSASRGGSPSASGGGSASGVGGGSPSGVGGGVGGPGEASPPPVLG